MAIVRRGEGAPVARREWDPFETMRELMGWEPFRELPRLWRGEERAPMFAPAFDVRETKDAFFFKADLPGFRQQDVDVNLAGNRLTISGKRQEEEVDDTDRYYCVERTYGSFSRAFTLPQDIDVEHVHADMKEGVLTIRIPKTEQAQPKRIAIGGGAPAGKGKA